MLAMRGKALRKTTKAVRTTIKALKSAKTKHSKLPQNGKLISKGPISIPMTITQATIPLGSLGARSLGARSIPRLSARASISRQGCRCKARVARIKVTAPALKTCLTCRPLAVLSMCQPPGGHQRGMEIKG